MARVISGGGRVFRLHVILDRIDLRSVSALLAATAADSSEVSPGFEVGQDLGHILTRNIGSLRDAILRNERMGCLWIDSDADSPQNAMMPGFEALVAECSVWHCCEMVQNTAARGGVRHRLQSSRPSTTSLLRLKLLGEVLLEGKPLASPSCEQHIHLNAVATPSCAGEFIGSGLDQRRRDGRVAGRS